MTRAQATERAAKLQKFLGEGYKVLYDDVESGMTRFFYFDTLYKEVPNAEIEGTISVTDFVAPQGLRYEKYFAM